MLTLIARAHGRVLAEIVANGLVHRPHRAGPERQLPEKPSEVSKERALLKKIIKYMEDNIDDPEKIESVSRRFELTQRKLEALFKQHLGIVPSSFYLNMRMEHAREYLFYSAMSVREIALACGFSSPSVFCRAFRKFHQLSPRQYRRQVSADNLKHFSRTYAPAGAPQIVCR
ncbi:MAG: helix-turn-helix domain-containing protein [Vicinamibacterales bacterium]